MAEELTSESAPETPSSTESAPVESGQSGEQVQTESAESQPQTDDSTASEAKATEKPKKEKPVNLYDLPEFRNVQSNWTRQQQEAQQQIAMLQQRMQEQELSGLDDYERALKEAEIARNQLAGFQQQIGQQQQQEEANRRIIGDMQRISDKTGVPVEDLIAAKNYDDAWDIGIQYMKDEGATRTEQAEASKEANRTIVGGGKASTTTSRSEQALQKASEDKDPVAYLRELRMAKD